MLLGLYANPVIKNMLSGVLAGSHCGTGVSGPYQPGHRSGTGQIMIALDVQAFRQMADFEAEMGASKVMGVPRPVALPSLNSPIARRSRAGATHFKIRTPRRFASAVPSFVCSRLKRHRRTDITSIASEHPLRCAAALPWC